MKFIDISDNSAADDIRVIQQHLQNAGFSTTDSEWLVDVFKHPDCFGNPNGESIFREDFVDSFETSFSTIVESLTEDTVSIENDRQTCLALLFSCMLELGLVGGYPIWFQANVSSHESDAPGWISDFQNHAKFRGQDLNWHVLIKRTHFDDLLPFLLPNGIPLNRIVNLDLLSSISLQSWSSNDFQDPQELEFWFICRFKKEKKLCNIVKLNTLEQEFSTLSDEALGEKILGLINSIYYAMNIGSAGKWGKDHLNPSGDGWKVVAHELIPFLELISERQPELKQQPSPLLKAWWHLSKYIYSRSYGDLETELTDDLRNRLVDSASRHIGILRSILRDSPERFKDVSDFYDKAFYVLLSFSDPWKRIKPLLLAFSEMTEPAVAKDLRTWREIDSEHNPPRPYSRVAHWIEVAMYSQNLRKELEKDQYLHSLREEFAKFCLGRLRTKTRKEDGNYTDEDFVEPRVAWRIGYVEALRSLRVNPGGRAHKTLFWILNNDPSEEVREHAKKAHSKVRHLDRKKPNLDVGASPRRPLFEAFLWLRQAHLIALGEPIDAEGAMRTHRKELHRTREKDDRFIRNS